MTVKEETELRDKVKLYRIGVAILLVAIFLLAEECFRNLNKYNELSEQMEKTQEEYEEKSYKAGYEDGYEAGYDKGCSIYLSQGMSVDEYLAGE